MKRKEGFTLIELLIVIAIIALLMGILVPALSKAREHAKRAICGSDMKQIGVAVIAYSEDTDFLPFYGGWDAAWKSPFNVTTDKPDPQDEGHPYAALRNDSPWRPAGGKPYPMKLACLYPRYIGNAKAFYCPSMRDPTYQYESYVKPLPPDNTSSDWGTLPQLFNDQTGKNQWVRIGYSYYPIDETLAGGTGIKVINGNPVTKYTARRFSVLSRKSPYLTDMMWKRKSLSHKAGVDYQNHVKNGGTNALFKDGHVVFTRDQTISYIYGMDKARFQGKLFDNKFWDDWDPPGADPPENIKADYIFYNIFRMIKP